ncbi:MAG: tannase/feruloyl esterase family alpha/beta hydrolase [Devosia sp.]|uniref:tannase/feruloyl esterase family alpha/beta hydrolase n=1 Tax=Devosia sp. TaxID=1871048 RepID=UPI0024CC9AEE|nr:tannase/feruloyl esterase family alpha/beta hydrolase [Devosia sp.]UYO01075.1 MAG: tannase/feruloyl esterase family alpha/beta hydrolase [Devosia sp.]
MLTYWRSPIAIGALLATTAWAGPAMAESLDCASVAGHDFGIEGLVIASAEALPVGENAPVAHCMVKGHVGERTGVDGNTYRVSFDLRLPDDWNGRFVHQFNGGNDGAVVPAMGDLRNGDPADNALSRNYAVVSSDAGHDGAAHPEAGLAGGAQFGFDPEARSDYGYSAVAKLNPVATDLVEAYYGEPIAYSYGVGGSNGGRHGLVQATRLPDAFDGILAAYPGFNLPRAAVQHAWDVQAFKAINGDIRTAFTQEDLTLVADAVLAACDGLDDLEDGIIADYPACQASFDVTTLTCAAGSTNACLAPAQVEALQKIHAGPTNSAGEQLYSNWAWDRGIASGNWRFWKLESGVPPWDSMPLIATMGAASLATIFSNPPVDVGGDPAALEQFLLDYDFDTDVTVAATTDAFAESPMDFMTPTDIGNPEMAEFRDAGGKMIVFHGISDPVFSVMDTISWYEKLDANADGKAADFVKFYAVPGMGHGSGSPATDKFDAFSALVDWVENGNEPDFLVATATPDNEYVPEMANITRKLCPYPTIARFTGGVEASYESFACK